MTSLQTADRARSKNLTYICQISDETCSLSAPFAGRVCNGSSIRWPVAAFLCQVGLKHRSQATGQVCGFEPCVYRVTQVMTGLMGTAIIYWIHSYCYFCGRRIIIPVIALTLPVTCVLDQPFSAVVSWFEQNWFPLNKTMEFDHAKPGRVDLALAIGAIYIHCIN